MTLTLTALDELRARIAEWKRAGDTIAFVPTMGNLHDGHFSLVQQARTVAQRVVVSVFVNPTQFGPTEDFARYPRTPVEDAEGLRTAGCDLLWLPSVETMYPFGATCAVRVQVPGVTDVLEGQHRPGHFDGVATVVSRLFLQVQPDIALFGRKDYQQLAVIRYLVRDLAFPLRVVGAETSREDDGLALSSRNQYLSALERARAPAIHRTLRWMERELAAGARVPEVEMRATRRLSEEGFDVDYASVRRRDLAPAARGDREVVALIAARLGRTRLIDNLEMVVDGGVND